MSKLSPFLAGLLMLGCSGGGSSPPPSEVSPSATTPEPLRVVFLLNANGISEVAIKAGKLKEIHLLAKDNSATLTEISPWIGWKESPKDHGIVAGEFFVYASRYIIPGDKTKPRPSDVSGPPIVPDWEKDRTFGGGIFATKEIPVPGKLRSIRILGPVHVTGSHTSAIGKGGVSGMNRAPHMAYEAIFEPDAK